MSKKKTNGQKKKVYKFKISSLATHRYRAQGAIIISPESAELKELSGSVVARYKPIIQKIGKNYVELMPVSEIEPMTFHVSPSFKTYTVSPGMQKLANLMKKAPIAGLRRIGRDIIDD